VDNREDASEARYTLTEVRSLLTREETNRVVKSLSKRSREDLWTTNVDPNEHLREDLRTLF
jgi:hypothetical protein